MASSFEKSVKGATKIKAAPPKTKYIEHILIATHSGEHGVAEVFRSLQNRLRDSTWTVVFKSLITVHLMIREGSPDVTLAYLANHRNMLAISSFSEFQTQGRNIRHYANYLAERAKAFRDTKCDFVRGAEHRFEKLSVEKGLLRETEIVQHQITALLKCDVLDNEPENEITITVFRMLVLDLLAMFHVLNQALINILGRFFEMSKTDAERAMEIYRNFTRQTDFVVGYLGTARQYEHQTRVEVPKLKHAPVNLGKQLEDYLADPDFEINRRQYLAEQEAKGGRGGTNGATKLLSSTPQKNPTSRPGPAQPTTNVASQPAPAKAKGPDPDLIDFFDSIEQNQQPMAAYPSQPQQMNIPNFAGAPQYQQSQPFQQNGFGQQPSFQSQAQFQQPQYNNGFAQPQQQSNVPNPQLQPGFTGAGFGTFAPQPAFQATTLPAIPQDNTASFDNTGLQSFSTMNTAQQQSTNPFRQSVVMPSTSTLPGPSFSPPATASPISAQSTNPFAKPVSTQQVFSPPSDHQGHSFQQQTTSPLQTSATGTNPFARNLSPPVQQPTGGQMMPQATGTTNPFRQSAFVNTATGSGWQNSQQPMGGGLDSLDSVAVFPRPAQQQPWQQ